MLRIIKIVLVATIAAFGFIGGIFNLAHWGETVGSVTAVTTMSSWEGGAADWRAVTSTPLSWLGAIWIMIAKLIAAVLCTMSVARMWRTRNASTAEFAVAKTPALTGCGVAVFMLFGGFIVVAETWFELWRSDAMRGPVLDSAYRYIGSILLIAVFVASNEPE